MLNSILHYRMDLMEYHYLLDQWVLLDLLVRPHLVVLVHHWIPVVQLLLVAH